MVRLDRIKTVSPLTVVNDFNAEYFTNISNSDGKEQSWIFDSRKLEAFPFKLYIKFDFKSKELVLEVSSKVLGDQYHEGIHYSNYNDLLNRIAPYVEINKEILYLWSDVISVDVRQDIPIALTKSDFEVLPLFLKSTKKFDFRTDDTGVYFQKNGKTRNRNFHLKFYDKENEIILNKNELFLSGLSEPNDLIESFRGKTRVELELKSKYLLRKYFDLHDLSIDSILRNRGDPIQKVCREIFDVNIDIQPLLNISNLSEYKQYLVVKECEFQIDLVEQKLRQWGSPKTNYRSAIRPYKEIISHYQNGSNSNSSVKLLNQIIHN